MPNYLEDAMLSALQIRDTDAHTSAGISAQEMPVKTLIVYNGLNQTVTLQMQGSRDNTNFFNIGSTFDVSATTWTYQTCDTFFPYGRIIAQCGTAPTTGDISVWCEKVRY